jgi:hypothetical protein
MERMQTVKLVRTLQAVGPALMPRCLVQVSHARLLCKTQTLAN